MHDDLTKIIAALDKASAKAGAHSGGWDELSLALTNARVALCHARDVTTSSAATGPVPPGGPKPPI